jgi:Daxx Family.
MQIYSKICELRKRRVDLGRPTHSKVKFECTEYPAINRTIEKFYNKTHQFPDYGDVLSLVQKVSDSSGLHLSSALVQHVGE